MSVTQEKRVTKGRTRAAHLEECAEKVTGEETEPDENRRVARMLVQRHLGALKRLAKR